VGSGLGEPCTTMDERRFIRSGHILDGRVPPSPPPRAPARRASPTVPARRTGGRGGMCCVPLLTASDLSENDLL